MAGGRQLGYRNGAGRWRSGLPVSIVDLDPVTVRVLEVDLPNAVCSDGDALRLTGNADIGDAVFFQSGERRFEVSSGKCEVGGERTGPPRFGIAPDQVNGSEAVNGEPPDMSLADPVGDLFQAENIGVEGCACIDIPHKKRDMVEGEMIRHRQAFPVEWVRLIGLHC